MKIVSMRVISDSEIPLRPIHRKWIFEPEEGVIDADGAVLFPTCRCCSLKQVPKLFQEARKDWYYVEIRTSLVKCGSG